MIIHEGTFLSVEEGGHFYPLLTHSDIHMLTLATGDNYTSGLC